MDGSRHSDRSERVRVVGDTIGDTAQALGTVEAKIVESLGALTGEATRVMGSAAARTADQVRPGSGGLFDLAADSTAQAVEATGRMAGSVLDSGGRWLHDMSDAATNAAAGLVERVGSDDDEDSLAPPTYIGPS